MAAGTMVMLSCLAVAAGCGNESSPASVEPDVFDCSTFAVPARVDDSRCDDPSLSDPTRLASCARGSGHLGRWTVDADGLPAYDFSVEQRCDPIARAYSPRTTPLRDPVHLIGNGRGLVAMAHASGAVEIYTQDRGHKWINRVDLWSDPANPSYPPQLGGGFNYYTLRQPDGSVRVGSTRFEDLPVNRALEQQSRRFGTGYFETVTRDGGLEIRRRVLAPPTEARALVVEVTLENHSGEAREYGLVELWDLNLHQLPVELITSDVSFPGVTERIDRKRRDLAGTFTQQLEWNASDRVAVATTNAKSLPPAVASPGDVSRVDYFPEPAFLALLDDGVVADGVWLSADELWPDADRRPPIAVAGPASTGSRRLSLDGSGQPALFAVRVPVTVPAHGSVTRHFAFGYVPAGNTIEASLAELRETVPSSFAAKAAADWRERLVWAAFPGLDRAGVMQRELAWAAYNTLANVTFDEYRGLRVIGQGGSYKYIHGIDGAMGDLALFAEAVTLIDPALAADTLGYAFASQMGGESATPWRFPYATTGVGNFTDVVIYNQRSDAYFFLPAVTGRYLSLTRDRGFLDRSIAYWPRSAGESGTVLDHLRRTIDYANVSLGIGARGLAAMGTGDYADGVLALADEPTTPGGTSSTYNAGMAAFGFPVAAGMIAAADPTLASELQRIATEQGEALIDRAWEGQFFFRGFVDSGNPLAPDYLFLEPQLFPILAGLVDAERRDVALASVTRVLETDIGAVSNTAIGEAGPIGGPDQPLVGGIWPVANAWLTEVYAGRDPEEGWSSFVRNTLAAHAEKYPDLWYGIWTGPDSFNGPDNPRPGEADAHSATALTDYPAFNMHMHTSPLRALMGLMGIEGTAAGLRITPRVPTERYSVQWPRLGLAGRESSISGYYVASAAGPTTLDVALPSRLRARTSVATEIDGVRGTARVENGRVVLELPTATGQAVRWRVDG